MSKEEQRGKRTPDGIPNAVPNAAVVIVTVEKVEP